MMITYQVLASRQDINSKVTDRDVVIEDNKFDHQNLQSQIPGNG